MFSMDQSTGGRVIDQMLADLPKILVWGGFTALFGVLWLAVTFRVKKDNSDETYDYTI